jgi:hypothetical protein
VVALLKVHNVCPQATIHTLRVYTSRVSTVLHLSYATSSQFILRFSSHSLALSRTDISLIHVRAGLVDSAVIAQLSPREPSSYSCSLQVAQQIACDNSQAYTSMHWNRVSFKPHTFSLRKSLSSSCQSLYITNTITTMYSPKPIFSFECSSQRLSTSTTGIHDHHALTMFPSSPSVFTRTLITPSIHNHSHLPTPPNLLIMSNLPSIYNNLPLNNPELPAIPPQFRATSSVKVTTICFYLANQHDLPLHRPTSHDHQQAPLFLTQGTAYTLRRSGGYTPSTRNVFTARQTRLRVDTRPSPLATFVVRQPAPPRTPTHLRIHPPHLPGLPPHLALPPLILRLATRMSTMSATFQRARAQGKSKRR